jgi:hypothetical protein
MAGVTGFNYDVQEDFNNEKVSRNVLDAVAWDAE